MIPQPRENVPVAVAWMLATMLLFVSLDALAKYLLQSYPTVQVVWARFFFHALILAVYLNRAWLRAARSANIGLQLWRSVLMLATNACFFIGISTTPLATASTILFLSPILVTVLAIPLLKEKVGFRRWLGVLLGFIGALIVVRPDTSGIATGALFLLVAALCNALYQIGTRQARAHDREITSLIYTGLIGAIGVSVAMPWHWQTPQGFDWLLFVALGGLGLIGHLCLIRAFNAAQASVVVPFSYSSLLWSSLYGFALFDEIPDGYTLIGAALIIVSGMYIFYRELRLAG